MHLFSSTKFWEQLKKVCKTNTKILFNVVSENIIESNYNFHEAYMKYNKGKINYYFPWSHTHEISEDFITNNLLEETIKKYPPRSLFDDNKINIKIDIDTITNYVPLFP